MAGLHKDKRTGIYTVQFYDAARSPNRKQASTGTRDVRSARRIHRRWEGAYAEGRYDPWTENPPDLDREGRRPPRAREGVTLADARSRFLASRSHRALNTRLNYERVTGWFVDHLGDDRQIASVTAADVQG